MTTAAVDEPARAGDRPDTAVTQPPRQQRDPFFDNAKFLAIVLVVIGHAWPPLRDESRFVAVADLWVYAFHMPLFILLAGYFSQRFSLGSRKARKLITSVAIPYIVFEVTWPLFGWLAGGNELDFHLLNPDYAAWFLIALFCYRLSTPVWQQVRWPLALAVAISLLSGMEDLPSALGMSRMLGFLPFFVLGLLLRPEHFAWLRQPKVRVAAVALLAGAAMVAWFAEPRMSGEWVYWRIGYEELAVSDLVGVAMRFAILVCGFAMSAAFLALVPGRKTWFSGLGTRTMYVFLLHMFVLTGLAYLGVDIGTFDAPLGIAVILLGSVALAAVLATPPVRWLFRWAIEPKLSWFFRRKDEAAALARLSRLLPGRTR